MRVVVTSCMILVMLLVLPFGLISQESIERQILEPGNIEGYVFNYYGLAISGATIGIEDGPITSSGADGYYFLAGVEQGDQSVGCGKTGYNPSWVILTIVSGDTAMHDFNLTQPVMVINPLLIGETINPGEYLTTSLNILNNGTGPLGWQAEVNYLSMPLVTCDYSIALFDTWGDGWTGCSLDVLVNDSVVLDNITLNNGTGPVMFYFPVLDGDQITTDFTPGPFVTEPYYYIYDTEGAQVWFSPAGSAGPPDILPGQLFASCTAGEWLKMDNYNGTVPPFGGVDNVPTHLDAAGTNSGETYNANIVITSSPFAGEITIPVTMTVQGSVLEAPENLAAELTDFIEGEVELSWDWNGDAFQFFLVKRDGQIIATTTSQYYTDILEVHGYYCYTVQAFYNEGLSSPEGPECVEWPNPVLYVNPDDLHGWVWTGFSVDVFSTVFNQGEGTLAYTFPEFAALHLLNNPDVIKNRPGSPLETQLTPVQKGDGTFDGNGYPIVLGAGGPDDFGYVWIDSDEAGGPTFSFTDISATGNPIYGLSDDNIVGPFDIGFDFYFYGVTKNQFWVNSNGCIGFTSNYITIQNTSLPTNSSVYNDFIAWMWDDLVFKTGSSQVFYQVFEDKLIIQFKNYEHYGQPGLFINAEIILHKDGKIMLLYDNFASGVNLNSCTVGLQSSIPTTGLQVAFNTAYLHNDLVVLLSIPADFIIDVQPAFGTVPEGGSEVITITYDSQDYEPGPYTQELFLESNDLANPEYTINNTMHVYLPAIFSGTVLDNDNDEPLNGVLVTAGPFQATTGENGEFTLYVDEGTYDVEFEKLGYKNISVRDTAALENIVSPINIGMWDMNYAPGFVHAEVMDDDTWCELTWSLPNGPYEIILEDGEADDYFVFAHAGSWHAVKFTPAGYPSTVTGGKFYVGDGSFPGPFLGTEFGVAVFDDDGVNGLPGTMLDSNGVTVNNSGWVMMDWLNAEITEGSFYLAMYQSGDCPYAAPIGFDTDNPTFFRSYTKFLANDWNLSPIQDFMIRAWVDGPESDDQTENVVNVLKALPVVPSDWSKFGATMSGTLPRIFPGYERNDAVYKGLTSSGERNVADFIVARFSDFDPYGPPTAGTITEIISTPGLNYNDSAWADLPMGWYAYGVKALYTSGLYSDYTVSNLVPHMMDFLLGINVTLSDGLEPNDVRIKLKGPYTDIDTIISEGSIVFDLVWRGHYDISAFKIGYDYYQISNSYLNQDKVFNILLSEKKYPPTCLYVDPVSLKATWCQPLITALKEDFEDPAFPPAGWQTMTADGSDGWVRANSECDSSFAIPPWDSYYAVSNKHKAGTDNNGCCDYLITPPLDLRESEGYTLSFDSFYNGEFGGLAFVEYSLDDGNTWEVLSQLMPAVEWTGLELDLDSFSGQAGHDQIWFAFHYNNGGDWSRAWGIDNVCIQVPSPAVNSLEFWVFLDNAMVGTTTETTWDFAPLPYGQTYTVSVAAKYSSGLSSKDSYTFTSAYLFPPQHFAGSAPDDAAILSWDPPGNSLPTNLMGYNIYRDGIFLEYAEQTGPWTPQLFVEENMPPGIYPYAITGVYDLEPYGLPGETGESMKVGPAVVTVDYCTELEFVETWDLGTFDKNNWISDGPNWSINGQTGNPAPVAEFSWNPVQTDYEIALESYPLCAAGLTEGNIWLDYNLALFSVQPSAEEKLKVQVWGWDAQVWKTVAEYNNSEGTFDWISVRLNIRQQAMNKVFKIRFQASGSNSTNIRGWFVDNVHIYRTCTAPTDLTVDPASDEGILLTWELADHSEVENGGELRELNGCKVYRSINGEDYELLPGLVFGNEFVDPEEGLILGSLYCYKVSAVWESETDFCESGFSNEACILYTTITGNHFASEQLFNLYPNPAENYCIISSSEELKQLTIYNTVGRQIFKEMDIGDEMVKINTAGYAIGVYLVKVETATGISSRLLTIQR